MKNVFEIRRLTDDFYKDYPVALFPEIERKNNRPYAVLLIKIEKLTFAIPLRTNIHHSSCYKFKTSDRKTNSTTGLDFSKAVVISKNKYIGDKTVINNKEYIELQRKSFFIRNKFKKYVMDYLDVLKGTANKFIIKRYRYSTLKYFDKFFIC